MARFVYFFLRRRHCGDELLLFRDHNNRHEPLMLVETACLIVNSCVLTDRSLDMLLIFNVYFKTVCVGRSIVTSSSVLNVR